MSNTVKVVCSRGHREKLVCQLAPSGTTFTDAWDVYTLPDGTLLAEPRPTTRRAVYQRPGVISGPNPVHGGNKLRLQCPVSSCRLDVPLSWQTVEESELARRLVQGGLQRIELSDLAATVSR